MSTTETPQRKKVLFIITKASWGGAQRYFYDVAANLPRDQYEAVVAYGGDGPLAGMLADVNIRSISITGLQRDVSIGSEIKAFFTMIRIIRAESPDVLHVTSSKAGVMGSVLGRLLLVPRVIFTACAWAFNEDRSRLEKFIIKLLHWITVLFAHQTIVLSTEMKRQMRWLGTQHKMKIINPGRRIPAPLTREEARTFLINHQSQAETTLHATREDLWIGSIAELHPTKRLNVAIDAIAQLVETYPHLRFVIIHDGDERDRLKQQVSELGLSEHVFFTGLIPEASKVIPAFDVFILPSKSEAFGYVLVEAGLAAVPVVATNVGGIPDIVVNNETGLLVPPDDASALAGAIDTLLRDPTRRAELAQAHHARCLDKFTIDAMMTQTIASYESQS